MTIKELEKENKILKELYVETNKALQAIEAASYFIDGGIGDYENASCKNLRRFAHLAYIISHSMQRESECYNSHDRWRKKCYKVLKDADRAGFAKYKNPLENKELFK